MKYLQMVLGFFDWLTIIINRFRDRAIQSVLKSRVLKPLVIRYKADVITHFRGAITIAICVFLIHNWLSGHNADFAFSTRWLLFGSAATVGLLDMVDGAWARLRREMKFVDGDHGANLDPFWDKIFTMSFFFYYILLLRLPEQIILIIIVVGDLAATGVRTVAKERGFTIAANSFGKWKMFFQTLSIIFLIAFFPRGHDVVLIASSVALTCGTISVVKHLILLNIQLNASRAVKEEITT